ncbi:MAG: hypothetical protein ACD_49C00064G0015 [uncultured bacterium (gcode 4)]|uniref:Uncharacterized protein n=1 Tax=uncultured bacterium (gcode 4) TaxID=1234023 RepID=K2AWF6_9BACT|nr:MAG: hypothetical protein ACD_49C00064G0015 [uncultured bacterium (gcode 4)]
MIFVKIFYGILLFATGLVIIKYRKIVYEWTGKFAWAERYLWSGGTVIVLTLIGLLLMFLGVTFPFWMYETLTKPTNIEQTNNSEIPRQN